MNTITWLSLIVTFIFMPVVISMLFEALRKQPQTPESLYWDKGIKIQYININGMRIRYIKTGHGPALVLLHTLRTQLDIFEKIIPDLTKDFTVYAPDYPGHGFSDITNSEYTPNFFVSTIEQFLEELEIENATLAGISIGGSIPLLAAAKNNQRIKNIIAINPYDYGAGMGASRANLVSWLIFNLSRIPVIGETVMRFRLPFVEKIIFEGGVTFPNALTKEFIQQVWDSGVRKNHYRRFINLIRNSHLWESARHAYIQINKPVLLIYGDNDWSNDEERQRTLKEIPGAKMEIVNNGGHFLSLDQPEELTRLIRQFSTS